MTCSSFNAIDFAFAFCHPDDWASRRWTTGLVFSPEVVMHSPPKIYDQEKFCQSHLQMMMTTSKKGWRPSRRLIQKSPEPSMLTLEQPN